MELAGELKPPQTPRKGAAGAKDDTSTRRKNARKPASRRDGGGEGDGAPARQPMRHTQVVSNALGRISSSSSLVRAFRKEVVAVTEAGGIVIAVFTAPHVLVAARLVALEPLCEIMSLFNRPSNISGTS